MTPKTKQKIFQTTDATVFTETCKALSMNAAALCTALGYSSNSSHAWTKSGTMPKVAAIACEALRKRLGTPGDAVGKSLVVVDLENGRAVRSRTFDLETINDAKVGTQSYYLIPKTGGAA